MLPFTLLGDTEGQVAKAFGVPAGPGRQLKVKAGGKEITTNPGVLIQRWTFVIGKDGKVAYKNEKANPRTDAKQVLDALAKQGK